MRLRLSILLSVLFFCIVSALAYFSSDHRVVVSQIVVNGTHVINKDEIEDVVRHDLSGRYLFMFDKSNMLIYPKSVIYTDLVTRFHRIDQVSISIKHFNTLQIDVTERSGIYLYCGAQIPLSQEDVGEHCYFINHDGYIFDSAPYISGDVYFKYYKDIHTDNSLGTQLLPVEQFHSLTYFIDSLSIIGFKSRELFIDDNGDCSLSLQGSPENPSSKILFKIDDNFDTIRNNLQLAMEKTEFANQIKTQYTALAYIDLRFKNKVLYKFYNK